MNDITVVHLTRDLEDIPVSEDWDRAVELWLKLFDDYGRPMFVNRRYIQRLREKGWKGTDQIPEHCIQDATRS
jgi:hypothetical protein